MEVVELLLNASRIVDDYIRDEFIKQGHHLTGEWEDSIKHQEIGKDEVEGLALNYGFIVNIGITSDRIPYGKQGSDSSGGKNAYIESLVRYWLLRKPGINEKQALRLAFATAEVQKREGMSTEASKIHSSTGKRQGFLDSMKILFEDYLDNWIFEGLYVIVDQKANEPKTMYL